MGKTKVECRIERLRNRHKSRVINFRRLKRGDVEYMVNLVSTDNGHSRPRTRADCEHIPRPCPFVSCKHNMFLDATNKDRSIKLNFPDKQPCEMEESCVLDIADSTVELTYDDIARVMNLTVERSRQIEKKAIKKLLTELSRCGVDMRGFLDE